MKMRSLNLFISTWVALGFALTLAMEARSHTPESMSETDLVESAIEGMESDQSEDATISRSASVSMIPRDRVRVGDQLVSHGQLVREVVSISGTSVLEGESWGDVVSIAGDSIVNGIAGGDALAIWGDLRIGPEARVRGDGVAVLGDLTLRGKLGGDAVAVLGDVYLDGEVAGDLSVVLGDVTLGPHAVLHGEVDVVGGELRRDVASTVSGSVQELSFPGGQMTLESFRLWIHKCLLLGRPLGFHAELSWAWMIAGAVFLFYVLLALLFPRAIRQCVATLNERPGHSLLAMLLSSMMTPVLLTVMFSTVIGALLVPFILLGIFLGTIFGKAVMHTWLGGKLTRYFGDGDMKHVALATLMGGGLMLLLYTVPFAGFVVWKVFGMLGWGVVIYTLILEISRNRPESPPVAAAASSDTRPQAESSAYQDDGVSRGGVAPELPVMALSRAGFWLRLLASTVDLVVVGLLCRLLSTESYAGLIVAIYCLVLWALKGTTIGGIIFGLKIVRLDDRPMDWSIALVRVLSGFLSLIVMGIGFIWVAFDGQKQSWHDKIAGTVVVRAPEGVSLI